MPGDSDPQPSILLVDDEPEILNSLKGLLRRDFRLFTAQSGAEALEILKHESIDVVMTDQRMPEMTGSELLQHAKQVSPDSVRIMFTGYADIKAVVDAVNQAHLYSYVTKPWDPEDLLELLHQAADEFAHRRAQRGILSEAKSFLDDWLHNGHDQQLQSVAESLRARIESELDSGHNDNTQAQ